ncbi:MAG TPA: Dabb family protein [Panacibacter sp.]|nr:Dabb family protein [Panacibacter sp.]
MIKHTVVFKLKYPGGSKEAGNFFAAAAQLANIPGVENFESLKQVSKKNNYDFCLSMQFENQELYNAYNIHPSHVAFIQQYWLASVADFMELDYEALDK